MPHHPVIIIQLIKAQLLLQLLCTAQDRAATHACSVQRAKHGLLVPLMHALNALCCRGAFKFEPLAADPLM